LNSRPLAAPNWSSAGEQPSPGGRQPTRCVWVRIKMIRKNNTKIRCGRSMDRLQGDARWRVDTELLIQSIAEEITVSHRPGT
jgi:hypothetical protein